MKLQNKINNSVVTSKLFNEAMNQVRVNECLDVAWNVLQTGSDGYGVSRLNNSVSEVHFTSP